MPARILLEKLFNKFVQLLGEFIQFKNYSMSSPKVCKFFLEGKCNRGDNCKFLHTNTRNSNSGPNQPAFIPMEVVPPTSQPHQEQISQNDAKNLNNSKNSSHKQEGKAQDSSKDNKNNRKKKERNSKKLVKVNTETFEPYYDPPDMRVVIATPGFQLTEKDVFLAPGIFDPSDLDIYFKLIDEINNSGKKPDDLWKLWHGDSHLIADDHLRWKDLCPTFNMVIDKISKFFNMDVKATRFNLYENFEQFKPMHFDAAAVDPKKALTQNITVGVSFGATRDISFEHAGNRATVSFPLINGTVYGFCKQVNIDWRHGIPQLSPSQREQFETEGKLKGRISIIAWGWANQTECL